MERRDVLRRLVQTGALAMVGGVAGSCTARAAEDRTPSQAEGPFYPVDKPRDLDANLLRFRGRDGLAGGEALGLSGRPSVAVTTFRSSASHRSDNAVSASAEVSAMSTDFLFNMAGPGGLFGSGGSILRLREPATAPSPAGHIAKS